MKFKHGNDKVVVKFHHERSFFIYDYESTVYDLAYFGKVSFNLKVHPFELSSIGWGSRQEKYCLTWIRNRTEIKWLYTRWNKRSGLYSEHVATFRGNYSKFEKKHVKDNLKRNRIKRLCWWDEQSETYWEDEKSKKWTAYRSFINPTTYVGTAGTGSLTIYHVLFRLIMQKGKSGYLC